MVFEIRKNWFRSRWHVYMIGHVESDDRWLASFCSEALAQKFVRVLKFGET